MQKPANVQVIGILVLVSGAINILVGLGITVGVVLGTFLLGVVCLPLTLIPVGVGIYELIVGIRVVSNQPPGNLPLVGGLEIASILWGNFLSMIGGIVVLVFYNEPETKAYFEDLKSGTISM
jgi:hypothetical protein